MYQRFYTALESSVKFSLIDHVNVSDVVCRAEGGLQITRVRLYLRRHTAAPLLPKLGPRRTIAQLKPPSRPDDAR